MIQQILFLIIAGGASFYAFRQFMAIRQTILLGQDEEISGDAAERWRNVLLIAFGQKKMFKRWIPAVFHLFIYVAFLFSFLLYFLFVNAEHAVGGLPQVRAELEDLEDQAEEEQISGQGVDGKYVHFCR